MWTPNTSYEVGDSVIAFIPKRRTFWQWLLRRPPELIPVTYRCTDTAPTFIPPEAAWVGINEPDPLTEEQAATLRAGAMRHFLEFGRWDEPLDYE